MKIAIAIGIYDELTILDVIGPYQVLAFLPGAEVVFCAERPVASATTTAWSTWTTSVCTGPLLLGAAGALDGRRATTHWRAKELLAGFGATTVDDRVVIDGKVVTGASVSAGIDMALTLGAQIAGPEVAQAIQLGIEYDPQPPFDAGAPWKAPTEIV